MTPPDYYIASSSDYYDAHTDSPPPSLQQHSLNNKIMVAAIVVLFFAILFITILHIFAKWLWRSRNSIIRFYNQEQATSAACSAGLSEAAIAQLPIFTYTNTEENAGLLECAVCLSEFQENEKGRLLPSCKHSFHTECIDMWLYSHSTCPLCRTVIMPTITNSPLMPLTVTTHEQQQEREEGAPQEAHISIETTVLRASAHVNNNPLCATAIPDSGDHLAHAVEIPTNVLLCGNSTCSHELGSVQSSEKPSPSSSAKATRCMPHITVEIPTRQLDINLTSPSCLSLPSRRSRCTSPHDTDCSSRTPLKSPGLRVSFKRMLNGHSSCKGKSIHMESPKEL